LAGWGGGISVQSEHRRERGLGGRTSDDQDPAWGFIISESGLMEKLANAFVRGKRHIMNHFNH
jgi:hypothetical protein